LSNNGIIKFFYLKQLYYVNKPRGYVLVTKKFWIPILIPQQHGENYPMELLRNTMLFVKKSNQYVKKSAIIELIQKTNSRKKKKPILSGTAGEMPKLKLGTNLILQINSLYLSIVLQKLTSLPAIFF
jgi:hypothetical protein